jgi:hypothetical protein
VQPTASACHRRRLQQTSRLMRRIDLQSPMLESCRSSFQGESNMSTLAAAGGTDFMATTSRALRHTAGSMTLEAATDPTQK